MHIAYPHINYDEVAMEQDAWIVQTLTPTPSPSLCLAYIDYT